MLRGVKNRYGSSAELGMYEMQGNGLVGGVPMVMVMMMMMTMRMVMTTTTTMMMMMMMMMMMTVDELK
jgi:predicted ATP-dependent serine protease